MSRMKTHFLFLILLLPGMVTAQSDTQHKKDSLQQSEYDNGRGMALYILSVAYGEMNRYEEEEQYAWDCINIIKDMDGMLGVTAQVYTRLCNA